MATLQEYEEEGEVAETCYLKEEGRQGYLWSCFFGVLPFTNALLLKWSLTLQNVRA